MPLYPGLATWCRARRPLLPPTRPRQHLSQRPLGLQLPIRQRLCLRERAGYQLLRVRLALEGGGEVDAFTFSGSTGAGYGAEFWAPAPPAELARVVAAAEGASGRNLVYFFELLRSMRGWGVVDPHLELIWAALLRDHRDVVAAVLGEAALLLEKGAAA